MPGFLLSLRATHGLALDVGAEGMEVPVTHAPRWASGDRWLIDAYADFWYGRPDTAEAR